MKDGSSRAYRWSSWQTLAQCSLSSEVRSLGMNFAVMRWMLKSDMRMLKCFHIVSDWAHGKSSQFLDVLAWRMDHLKHLTRSIGPLSYTCQIMRKILSVLEIWHGIWCAIFTQVCIPWWIHKCAYACGCKTPLALLVKLKERFCKLDDPYYSPLWYTQVLYSCSAICWCAMKLVSIVIDATLYSMWEIKFPRH